MDTEYEVRRYRQGDEEQIVELLQLVFDGWPHYDLSCSSLDHWKWKYEDNPLKMNLSVVGVAGGKIIGCNHLIPLRLKIGDEVVLGASATDLAVHPDYRRLGVLNSMRSLRLKMEAERGCRLSYTTTSNPILIKTMLRNVPFFPYSISNMVRIRDIDLQLRAMPAKHSWFLKLGFGAATFINNAESALMRKHDKADVEIVEAKKFDERIDALWEEASKHHDFIVERRAGYLNWRYCDPRAGGFVVRQAEREGRILGYSVLRINRYLKDYPVGYIVDLLVLPDRMDVADALVSDAVDHFDRAGVNIVNFQVVKNHPYQKIVKRNGFLDGRVGLYLFYRFSGESDMMKRIESSPQSRIFVSWGDHDVLPVRMPSDQ